MGVLFMQGFYDDDTPQNALICHLLCLHTNVNHKVIYMERMVVAMKGFESVSPIGLTIASIIIALIFVISFDSDYLNIIGNTLIGIGGIMIIAATQGAYLESLTENEYQKDLLEMQLENCKASKAKWKML